MSFVRTATPLMTSRACRDTLETELGQLETLSAARKQGAARQLHQGERQLSVLSSIMCET